MPFDTALYPWAARPGTTRLLVAAFRAALPQLLYNDTDHALQVYRSIIERKKEHVKSHGNIGTIYPSVAA